MKYPYIKIENKMKELIINKALHSNGIIKYLKFEHILVLKW